MARDWDSWMRETGGPSWRVEAVKGPEAHAAEGTSLPVAKAEPLDLLVNEQGAPVWPLAGDLEKVRCEGLAKLFGAKLSYTPATQGRAQKGSGVVIGLGDVAEEAQLYAHLTGRSWGTVSEVAQLPLPSPDIVIGLGERLDPNLVEHLSFPPVEDVPTTTGVIWGVDRLHLRVQVLIHAAAAVLNGSVHIRHVHINGTGVEASLEQPVIAFGHDAAPDEVAAAANCEAGLLSILGHGDGINAQLGDSLALCGVSGTPDQEDSLPPLCVETGTCRLFGTSRGERAAIGSLLPPSAISARIVALASCRAAFVGSTYIDGTWALLPRLLAESTLGALIASHEVILIMPYNLNRDLLHPLASGVPAGRALTAFHSTPTMQEFGSRFLLFGDPRARAAPPIGTILGRLEVSLQGPHPPRAAAPLINPDLSRREQELSLLRAIAASGPPQIPAVPKALIEAARASSDALNAAIVNCEDGVNEKVPDVVLKPLQLAAIEHLAYVKGRLTKVWEGSNYTETSDQRQLCPQCDWPVRLRSSHLPSGLSRQVEFCPRCEFEMDRPLTLDFRVRFKVPELELVGDLPQGRWSGGTIISQPTLTFAPLLEMWPRADDGLPTRTAHIGTAQLPKGICNLRTVFMVETRICQFGILARGGSS